MECPSSPPREGEGEGVDAALMKSVMSTVLGGGGGATDGREDVEGGRVEGAGDARSRRRHAPADEGGSTRSPPPPRACDISGVGSFSARARRRRL